MQRGHIPAATLAIIRNGKCVKEKAYGVADVELGAHASVKDVFEIGSMTKQFTATCILLLRREGKLRLSDTLSQYLSDIPDAWKPITLKQLLTHTSGIPNFTAHGDFFEIVRNPETPDKILSLVNHFPLDFPPGSKYEYSNTNYYLLSLIIEKITHMSLFDFMRKNIFTPLHMNATIPTGPDKIVPNRAPGYLFDQHLQNEPFMYADSVLGAGFLLSDLDDLIKWNRSLDQNTILSESEKNLMWTPAVLNDGSKTGYGLGWALGNVNGHPLVEHAGGTAGYSSIISKYPADHITIILLTNLFNADVAGISLHIAYEIVPGMKIKANAIKDMNPERTLRLTRILEGIASRHMDSNDFTSDLYKVLTGDQGAESIRILSSQGELKKLQLIGQKTEGGNTILTYKAIYAVGNLAVTFTLRQDGKVEGFFVSFE
jgi:CubicO group peptidase (beta-lactamase class C family)